MFASIAILTPGASMVRAQGFDVGITYAQLPHYSPQGNESKGPGLQAAIDLDEPDRHRFQFRCGYVRLSVDRTQADMANVGIQWAAWGPGQDGNVILALEGRLERLATPNQNGSYGRPWVRGGLGFRGILIPLFPWKAAVLAKGNDQIVPFTRIEWALPLIKRKLGWIEAPASEVSLQIGLRFNLD